MSPAPSSPGALTVLRPGFGFSVPGSLQLLRESHDSRVYSSSLAGMRSPWPSPRSQGTSEIRLHKPFTNHLTQQFRVSVCLGDVAGIKQLSRNSAVPKHHHFLISTRAAQAEQLAPAMP